MISVFVFKRVDLLQNKAENVKKRLNLGHFKYIFLSFKYFT